MECIALVLCGGKVRPSLGYHRNFIIAVSSSQSYLSSQFYKHLRNGLLKKCTVKIPLKYVYVWDIEITSWHQYTSCFASRKILNFYMTNNLLQFSQSILICFSSTFLFSLSTTYDSFHLRPNELKIIIFSFQHCLVKPGEYKNFWGCCNDKIYMLKMR